MGLHVVSLDRANDLKINLEIYLQDHDLILILKIIFFCDLILDL